MDQLQTGKFIAQMRKEKGLTQKQLAEELLISDKTVSKWECGKGMPELSLMLPLCKRLDITVNELLSGQRLSPSEYQKNAEENMMRLINEKEETKFRIIIGVIVAVISILLSCALFIIAGEADISTKTRVVLVIIGAILMIMGIGVAAALDMRKAVFECPNCGEQFIPTAKAYLMGEHTLTRRRLKCPHCGKKSMCIRRLSKRE